MTDGKWGKPGKPVKCGEGNFSYRTCRHKSRIVLHIARPSHQTASWEAAADVTAERPRMPLLSDNSASPVRREVLPKEVEFILSALEAGQFAGATRRRGQRFPYRVSASLKLFSDTPQAPPWQIFVRDVNPKSLGFVTKHRLPLGYGGLLTLASPSL
jgi:hypothetical protein